MEQHLIHIEVLDTATSQGRKSKINKTQTEKDGELEKEERNKGKKSTKQENNGKEKQKSVVNRFPRVRCKVDVILGRCRGTGMHRCGAQDP